MRKAISALGSAGLAVGLTLGLVGMAAPARAAERVLTCTWITDAKATKESTFDCSKPRRAATVAVFRDCWKYPPSEATHVKQRIPGGWVLADVRLRIERVPKACPRGYPWRTKVAIPVDGLVPYETVHYRLTMPASSGEDRGTPYEYGRTSINMFSCVVPEGSSRLC